MPPVANVRNPTITSVPPIMANTPAPMEISAISRTISLRKCTAACNVPPMAFPKNSV